MCVNCAVFDVRNSKNVCKKLCRVAERSEAGWGTRQNYLWDTL